MKAMILAAGLGTRLLPLTEDKPKALFPILGRPLIDILIRKLQASGCKGIVINTHHLAHVMDEFIGAQSYAIPVQTRYEPRLLGTGGAIRNVEDFWDNDPFLVINGDIFTSIDLAEVYDFHLRHGLPVTLVLHHQEPFNNVCVDSTDCITGFGHASSCPSVNNDQKGAITPSANGTATHRQLAFTGIHALAPEVLAFIPRKTPYSIIDVYSDMIRSGICLKALIARNHYWHDIGTPAGHKGAAREALARKALEAMSPLAKAGPLGWESLKGDASDRTWHRVSVGGASAILVDHGVPPEEDRCEADSFFSIGRHLRAAGVPVPEIYGYDRQLGLIALEDLGDLHLQTLVRRTDPARIAALYEPVIDLLITMSVQGAKGFDLGFTYQTPYYDRKLIIERESRYFLKAFLNKYVGLAIGLEELKEEFELLAEKALENDCNGFLHRDFQSRNIIVKDHTYYVIDFQGGRLGPLAYDLASLLIDPYVALSASLQETLFTHYLNRLSTIVPLDPVAFRRSYKYCAINRNLQILGAFAFLSVEKEKAGFKAYIPPALSSLQTLLQKLQRTECPRLSEIVQSIQGNPSSDPSP